MAAYRNYLLVWLALLVLTGATVAISYFELGLWNAGAALFIASVKGTLVALYFMHLRYEVKLVLGFAVFPLFILALLIVGTLMDNLFR
ncbi:cytochrome C oxidase subunit IV family protein [Geomesophilobacter sediminis]|uniref:Cytochrome C oxidase subunit IV family protein n=1 Tax=Geomesophilobacter sediminis TaxID=2798584 RepID=A0A8J7M096_9BACT|nr:cytochrome C oxidase subunit IV family protein [Geomesophilobacter sediminis]MBJ6724032.1 cytochrome C oxidase subunit IV family protein [Geomesophilobacter sediminis]